MDCLISVGVQVDIENDIRKSKRAESMRKATAKYKQKLIDENKYGKRLEYFQNLNYMKRHYYKKPEEFVECIKNFL